MYCYNVHNVLFLIGEIRCQWGNGLGLLFCLGGKRDGKYGYIVKMFFLICHLRH